MRMLSVVHGAEVRGEVFDDVVRADGHELDEWWSSTRRAAASARRVRRGARLRRADERRPGGRASVAAARGRVRPRAARRSACRRSACASAGSCSRRRRARTSARRRSRSSASRASSSPDGAAGDPLFGALPREFDVLERARYAFHVPEDARRAGALARVLAGVPARRQRVGRAVPSGDPRRARSRTGCARTASRTRSELVDELRERYDEWRSFGAGLLRSFLAAAEGRLLAAAEPPVDESSRFCHRQRGRSGHVRGQTPDVSGGVSVSRGRSSRRDHSCHEPT